MKTKIVVIDIFGTLLPRRFFKKFMYPRDGFIYLNAYCKTHNLPIALMTHHPRVWTRLGLDRSNLMTIDFYHSVFYFDRGTPKNYSNIARYFRVKVTELLVITDSFKYNYVPALNQGCKAILVPKYRNRNDAYDFKDLLGNKFHS